MDIYGAWTYHWYVDNHSCIFSVWIFRHGYYMDTVLQPGLTLTILKHISKTEDIV